MKHHLLLTLTAMMGLAATTVAFADEARVPAPAGAKLLLEAAAQGVQIYTCEKASDGYRWVFSAPDATLFNAAGRQIGTHFAGPTWQMEDGSKVVGYGASAAYGAARLNTKCTAASGQRRLTARAIASERAYSPMPN